MLSKQDQEMVERIKRIPHGRSDVIHLLAIIDRMEDEIRRMTQEIKDVSQALADEIMETEELIDRETVETPYVDDPEEEEPNNLWEELT